MADDPVVLYDGVCGMCNGFVRFALRRDRAAQFRFAPLQGAFAAAAMARHGADAKALETMGLVLEAGTERERLLLRSDAAAEVLARLGGACGPLGRLLRRLPRGFRDGWYRFAARHRYRMFGRHETCTIPPPEWRDRFLD